jgi:hypothetical protein
MTTHYDIGDGRIPDRIPRPDAYQYTPRPIYYNEPAEKAGKFEFVFHEDPAAVLEWFRRSFQEAGFEIDLESEFVFSTESSIPMGSFSASRGSRNVGVLIAVEPGKAHASGILSYDERIADGS